MCGAHMNSRFAIMNWKKTGLVKNLVIYSIQATQKEERKNI